MSTGNADKAYKVVKMTITFTDGHTEDFDTFITSVATGLIPAGRDEESGEVFYMAEKGKFQTRGITHIAASADVIAGLVETVLEVLARLIKGIEPEAALGILAAMNRMCHERVVDHGSIKLKRIDPKDN